MSAFAAACAALARPLLDASLGAALLAAAVLLLQRSRWAAPPRVAAVLWWLVAAKAITTLVWAVPLPVLPASVAPASASPASAAPASFAGSSPTASALGGDRPLSRTRAVAGSLAPAAARPARSMPTLSQALLGLWLVGVVLSTVRMAASLRHFAGLRRRATAVEEPALLDLVAGLSRRLGVRRVPELVRSGEVDSPLVFGLKRPTIILPRATRPDAGAAADDLAELGETELALAHELLHLRHRDLLWGLVPALAERLFFFHPLVRLAAREHALAVESARDQEVLSRLAPAPERYGRLLVRWGTAPRPAAVGAAAASSTYRMLHRRLAMLDRRSRRLGAAGIAALTGALLLAIPTRPVAAWSGQDSDRPWTRDAASQVAATSAPTAPTAATAPSAPGRSTRRTWPPVPPVPPTPPAPPAAPAPPPMFDAAGSIPLPPVPPIPPVPPVPPVAPAPLLTGEGPLTALMVIAGDDDITISTSDRNRVPQARLRAEGRDVVWFRYDGKAYAIRDQRTIDRVRDFLDRQMERTGGQTELAVRQSTLAAEQAGLAGQQAQLAAEQTSAAGGRRSSASAAERSAESARIDELRRRQDELRERQDDLRARQDALAGQQDVLREALEKDAERVTTEFTHLLESMVADGTAQLDR